MRREYKLIRAILEYVECHGNGSWINAPELNGYSNTQIMYHIKLCMQAGFLEAMEDSGIGYDGEIYRVKSLTWSGHNELERLRGGI